MNDPIVLWQLMLFLVVYDISKGFFAEIFKYIRGE